MTNRYRTHTCDVLRPEHIGQTVRLAGWVHRKRDHGQLLFIDLRDHYGITQCVFTPDSAAFATAEAVRLESVISVSGKVIARTPENVNPALPTGEVEVVVDDARGAVDGRDAAVPGRRHAGDSGRAAAALPVPRSAAREDPREHRPAVARHLEHPPRMQEQGFLEFQTPILTSSSPEGARDYLVPSRVHPGKFYALPQAPQQFKQLLMVAGLRSLLSDRALLPRRGRARRPVAGRVLPARRGDVLRRRRTTCSRRSSRCWPASFREFSDWHGDRRRRFRASPTTMRWRCTAATSRTCAIRSKAADVTDVFRGSEFAVFAAGRGRGRRGPRAFRRPGAAEKSRSFFDKTVGRGRVARAWRAGVHRRWPRRRRDRSRSIFPRSAREARLRAAGVQHGRRGVLRRPAPPKIAVASRSTALARHLAQGARAASRRTPTASAGSRTSRSTSWTRRRTRSASATIRSRCRKAASRR